MSLSTISKNRIPLLGSDLDTKISSRLTTCFEINGVYRQDEVLYFHHDNHSDKDAYHDCLHSQYTRSVF